MDVVLVLVIIALVVLVVAGALVMLQRSRRQGSVRASDPTRKHSR